MRSLADKIFLVLLDITYYLKDNAKLTRPAVYKRFLASVSSGKAFKDECSNIHVSTPMFLAMANLAAAEDAS